MYASLCFLSKLVKDRSGFDSKFLIDVMSFLFSGQISHVLHQNIYILPDIKSFWFDHLFSGVVI